MSDLENALSALARGFSSTLAPSMQTAISKPKDDPLDRAIKLVKLFKDKAEVEREQQQYGTPKKSVSIEGLGKEQPAVIQETNPITDTNRVTNFLESPEYSPTKMAETGTLTLPEIKPQSSGSSVLKQRYGDLEPYVEAVKKNPESFYNLNNTVQTLITPLLSHEGISLPTRPQFNLGQTKQKEAENDFNKGMASIGKLEELFNKTEPSEKAGVGSVVGGVVKKVGSYTQTNKEAATYESTLEGFIPILARAVGHTGVLTELDVKKTMRIFPDLFSSNEIGQEKFKIAKNIMERAKAGKLAAYADKFGNDYNAVLDFLESEFSGSGKKTQPTEGKKTLDEIFK